MSTIDITTIDDASLVDKLLQLADLRGTHVALKSLQPTQPHSNYAYLDHEIKIGRDELIARLRRHE